MPEFIKYRKTETLIVRPTIYPECADCPVLLKNFDLVNKMSEKVSQLQDLGEFKHRTISIHCTNYLRRTNERKIGVHSIITYKNGRADVSSKSETVVCPGRITENIEDK